MVFPDSRPVTYDADKVWDEDSNSWVAINAVEASALGGGRYRQQIVAVSNQGNIYYGDV